jgi:thiamine biosynthesis lipoprotein
MLDLGAIGKGFAVDRAAQTLRELGVGSALIHGGTSTVFAMGRPSDAPSWRIAVEYPHAAGTPSRLLAQVELHDESLSSSAVWGKHFTSEGRMLGHVIDPRTGEPTGAALLAAVVAPSATETDALSTALLTLGPAGVDSVVKPLSRVRGLVVVQPENGQSYQVMSHGIRVLPPHGD